MKPRDVHEAVDQLIQRQRVRLLRDDTGRSEHHTVPSLWEQLEASTAYVGTGTGAGGGFGSQPTISTDVVSLLIEISGTVFEAVGNNDLEPLRTTPDNLRRLAANLDDEDERDWWTEKVAEWCARCRVALRLNPPRPSWARGVRCPSCGADQAGGVLNGEKVRTPALAITWGGPTDDAYHPDSAWLVRAVECRQCGAVWLRGGDLDVLVDQMLRANLTRETLTEIA